MNTFWLKVAAGALAIIVLILAIGILVPSGQKPADEPGFGDMVERDREKFLNKPEKVQTPEKQTRPAEDTARDTGEVNQPGETAGQKDSQANETAGEVTLYFKPLPEIEKVQAERLLNAAVPGRSMTRLPMNPGQSLVVKNCLRIIEKWPDSSYAYQAKLILADLPEQVRTRANITEKQIDTSMYKKQRPGTEPFVVQQNR